MENPSIIQTERKYFIRSKGTGEMKVFMLIHSANFDSLDMFFQTIEDAKNYAQKNNLEIVEYTED